MLAVVLTAWRYQEGHRQRDAYLRFRDMDGVPYYDFQLDSQGELVDHAQPPYPQFVLDWVGIDSLARLKKVVFFRARSLRVRRLDRRWRLPLSRRSVSFGRAVHWSDGRASGALAASAHARPSTSKTQQRGYCRLGNGGVLATVPDLLRLQTVFCSQLANACQEPIPVERTIRCGYGCFLSESPELGQLIFHNGGNGVFSATIRWHSNGKRFLVVVCNKSDQSALTVARTISDGWKR